MRGKSIWGAWLLAVGLALTTRPALAQEFGTGDALGFGAVGYAPADPQVWAPLGSTHIELGGIYLYTEYVMYHQTNPLKDQQVAVRGFVTTDDSVPGTPVGSSGVFIGSRDEALNVKQVNGPTTYTPGFKLGVGWKFQDGSTLSLDWMYLAQVRYTAGATLAKAGFTVRPDFADSFLFANVYNFPVEFAGTSNRIAGASPGAVFGIWDGADVMTEDFVQRFQQWQMTYRVPVYDTECYRLSGLMGPRFVWIWERYKWTTTDATGDSGGNPAEANTAVYTNIDSNRMYGAFIGCSNEYYLGHGFACQVDLDAACFLDSVKEREQYNLLLKFLGPESKRARRVFTVAPELEANFAIQWYPTEFVQVKVGYNFMVFFNTLNSPRPIDFNYLGLTAPYESTTRLFDGFNAAISIIF
jgi:hypothetical protein